MKKFLSNLIMVLILVSSIGILTSCSSKLEKEKIKNENTIENSQENKEENKIYKIGINQFAMHPSLDNCRIGFEEGLAEKGLEVGKNLEIVYQNAEADAGIMNQISNNFVSKEMDLICAIATPSAQSAYNYASEKNIDVVYVAVTDPISAGLAKEDRTPIGNVTGVSDVLPVESQVKMIREILPEAKKLGILYTTSEVNSISVIEKFKEVVGKYDFELVTVGISNISELELATDNILSKVDCITNILDNTVVSGLPIVLEKANSKKIPVFGSEEEQVKNGCLASEGADYIEYGKKAGYMAYDILTGNTKAIDMKYQALEEAQLTLNEKVAKELGIKISEQTLNRAKKRF